jgi:hypothetical protein
MHIYKNETVLIDGFIINNIEKDYIIDEFLRLQS